MSNSQEQSLDENVVFLPVNESSPEFLHCEEERQAVERLLNAGPEAFYSSIGTERSGCFLSSEEVSQITSWAQDYRFNPLQVQREENGEQASPEMEDFCSTYFPSISDTPAPDLELGWPEKGPWVPKASVTVHTSPPAEGEPPVRQIIRQHLQKACQVIAIVTDRLTDGAIIGDLHNAASRGVPVYIILNQRSIQENFTLNRLRHPNMQVRVLGGKSFCSRTGRMVVGEMKDKFLLVDLETVIHGSYSFTWTDAHLHRQLITVLSGPVVDSFDREFRILFAASLPVPDTGRVAGTHVDVTHPLKDRSDLWFQRHHHFEPEIITNPPSPPADSLLDWEAMGVVQRECCFPDSPVDQHEEVTAKEKPLQSRMQFDKYTPVVDGFTNNGNLFMDKKRLYENISPLTNNAPHKSIFNNTQPSPTDLTTPERMKRLYENISPVTNNAPHKSTTFNNTQPTDLTTPERMKRLYENISPVANDAPHKSIFNNTQPSPTDLTTPERMKRLYENISPVTNDVPHKSIFNNTQPSPTDLTTPERMKRVEHIINKSISRQVSVEKSSTLNDRTTTTTTTTTTTRLDDRAAEPTHNMNLLSSSKRRERSRRDAILEEESSLNEISSKVENTPSSRKPLILRVPQQSESFGPLSDIMKKMQLQQSSSTLPRRGPKATVSELSHSMMELSVHNKDQDRGAPAPRFKASCFDPDSVTPALALMKKRNDDLKPLWHRTPTNFKPRERPRSSALLDWRRSLAETETERE